MNYYNNYHIVRDSEWNGASQKVYRIVLLFTLGPVGGALPHKAIQDVKIFRVSFVSINSWMGYENWSEIPKQVMTIQFKNNNLLFSRTIDYCFPIDFGFFCNIKIPKQGIGMQIFPKRVVGILKKWALPHQVTFKCPLPPCTGIAAFEAVSAPEQYRSAPLRCWKWNVPYRQKPIRYSVNIALFDIINSVAICLAEFIWNLAQRRSLFEHSNGVHLTL